MINLNLENVSVITLIVTTLGFYLAYFQYFKFSKDRKAHLLKILDGQLDCLGPWVGTNEGSGYGEELTEEQKYYNAMPGKVIYATGSSPLIDLTILESMNDVPDEIIGEINQLYYDIKRIESIQSFRNQLTSSDLKLSFSVEKKIKDYLILNPQQPFHHFLLTYKKKDDLEKMFIEKLVSYGKTLHCDVIGNKNKGASMHWTKIKDWIKKVKENELKPKFSFILITFFVSSLTIVLLEKLFSFRITQLETVSTLCLLTILFSVGVGAINLDYLRRKINCYKDI